MRRQGLLDRAVLGDYCSGFPPATLTFGTWPDFEDKTHVNFPTSEKLAPADDRTIVRDSLGHALDLFWYPDRLSSEHTASGCFAGVGQKLGTVAGLAQELSGTHRGIADVVSRTADKKMEPTAEAAIPIEAKDRVVRVITQVELLSASPSQQRA